MGLVCLWDWGSMINQDVGPRPLYPTPPTFSPILTINLGYITSKAHYQKVKIQKKRSCHFR